MWKGWIAGLLSLGLLLALSACGSQTEENGGLEENSAQSNNSSVQGEEQDALVEYAVEGLGTFLLPEGFTLEAGEIAEPLPSQYAYFEKDEYYIQVNRMGEDAYEAAGAALPADVEEFATRKGVQDAVPEDTVFAYDSCGNYAAQFTQEDGQICYYVLLQGDRAFGNIFLTAPEDVFDAETAALWLSGSQLN